MTDQQIKEDIYSELSRVLTDFDQMTEYNEGDFIGSEEELYSMLVKIQNNWESIIAQSK